MGEENTERSWKETLDRPDRVQPQTPPPLPHVDGMGADEASTTYSHYRTGLSNHRTSLSEHRTDLSEFRTDLSQHRTGLSENRTDMSMHRTGMSFQRTRMSANRTLMSVERTALSLIGFGFTIYQAFQKFEEAGALPSANTPRNFGMSLVGLGIVVLLVGIWNHIQFMSELRETRGQMMADGLIYGSSSFPISFALVSAVVLLSIGLLAIASMAFRVSLFG